MFHQQAKMVSSYLFSFRETSCPLFWISEFCLHAYLATLKCQQNLEFATLSGLTQIEQNKVNLDLKSRYFSVFNPLNPPCQGDFELFA